MRSEESSSFYKFLQISLDMNPVKYRLSIIHNFPISKIISEKFPGEKWMETQMEGDVTKRNPSKGSGRLQEIMMITISAISEHLFRFRFRFVEPHHFPMKWSRLHEQSIYIDLVIQKDRCPTLSISRQVSQESVNSNQSEIFESATVKERWILFARPWPLVDHFFLVKREGKSSITQINNRKKVEISF